MPRDIPADTGECYLKGELVNKALQFYKHLTETVNPPTGGGKSSAMVVRPFIATVNDPGLSCAVTNVLKIWGPQTTVVLYRYTHFSPAPIASLRLMPLRESLKDHDVKRMYWLSPVNTAAFVRVIGDIENAFGGSPLV